VTLVDFGAGIEKLEEVLLHALLARGVVRLLHVVFFVEVFALVRHVLHLGRHGKRQIHYLFELRVLNLLLSPLH